LEGDGAIDELATGCRHIAEASDVVLQLLAQTDEKHVASIDLGERLHFVFQALEIGVKRRNRLHGSLSSPIKFIDGGDTSR
ncbi:MAG: hypothetical protein M1812_008595, partial [Candelaria pacifica]